MKAIGDINAVTIGMHNAIGAIMVGYESRFQELREVVSRAEEQVRPRLYVTSRKSRKVHNPLTKVEGVGVEVMCYCSYKYS